MTLLTNKIKCLFGEANCYTYLIENVKVLDMPDHLIFCSLEKVAVKILDKTKLDEKTQRLLSREISSMEKLHHSNVIRIFEVLETLSHIYIVMEYAPAGELFHKILNDGKFSESLTRKYFAQILSAVSHMVCK